MFQFVECLSEEVQDEDHQVIIPDDGYWFEMGLMLGCGIMPTLNIKLKLGDAMAWLKLIPNPGHIWQHVDERDTSKSSVAFELAHGVFLTLRGEETSNIVQLYLVLHMEGEVVRSGTANIATLTV